MASKTVPVKSINEHARFLASQGRISWIDVHNLAVALRTKGQAPKSFLSLFTTPRIDRLKAAETVTRTVRSDEGVRAFFHFLGFAVASSVERPPLFAGAIAESQLNGNPPVLEQAQAGKTNILYAEQSVIDDIKTNGYRKLTYEELSDSAKEAIESGKVAEMEFFGQKRLGYFHKRGGGFVELSALVHDSYILNGAAVLDYATVKSKSRVRGNARVCGSAIVEASDIYENAHVTGHAQVKHSEIYGNASVSYNVHVENRSKVHGNARIHGNAFVLDKSNVHGNADISGSSGIFNSEVYEKAKIKGSATLADCKVYGEARVSGSAHVSHDPDHPHPTEIYGEAAIRGEAVVISSTIHGVATVSENAMVAGSIIHGFTTIRGDAKVRLSEISKDIEIRTGEITSGHDARGNGFGRSRD